MKFKLSPKQIEELLQVLRERFEKNMHRHGGVEWSKIQARLENDPTKLWSLNEMERTGGEPDVVSHDPKTSEYIFYDCSSEVRKAAEAFVTIARRSMQEKKTNRWIMLLVWLLSWE